MAVIRVGEKQDDKTGMLRVTVPKRLLTEIRDTKKLCKEYGFAFDIKPDVVQALEKALKEARATIEQEQAQKKETE